MNLKLSEAVKKGYSTGMKAGGSLDEVRRLAGHGNAEMQFVLSVHYLIGYPLYEAVSWLKKAADNGHVLAQSCLGDCYDEGFGVEKDNDQAVYWWKKAAEQGHDGAKGKMQPCASPSEWAVDKHIAKPDSYIDGATVGFKADKAEGWWDIIEISASEVHTVGLKTDGTVIATGDNNYGKCDTGHWRDIIAIAVGPYHTVGLKTDGTVIATGDNNYGKCDTGHWRDIIAIAVGPYHTVGLKTDGTVVATGYNFYGQCNVSWWWDIVKIFASKHCTVGLKTDGTVVATGYNGDGRCDTTCWQNIDSALGDKILNYELEKEQANNKERNI